MDGDFSGNLAGGSNYVTTFVVNAPAANAVTVAVPDFARGPDTNAADSINLVNVQPANLTGGKLYQTAGTATTNKGTVNVGPGGFWQVQGGSFTISSLGGIGGTAFTPIINAPEVAILGVSKSSHKPIFDTGSFVPRLMLPLSLSYDHRVIDGAEAARFVVFLSRTLSDVKALL